MAENSIKRESVIEKIKKLLALASDNPSVTEAAAAALKAQKLIADNDIKDYELHEVQTKEVMDPCFNRPPSDMRCEGVVEVSFKGQFLPKGSAYRVTVTPGGSLGNYGTAMVSAWTAGGVKV